MFWLLGLIFTSWVLCTRADDWIDYNGRTVLLPLEFTFMNWKDAVQHCIDRQAEPFIPYSAEDFEWMLEELAKLKRKKMNFPMTDVEEEGTPMWSNDIAVPAGCDYLKMQRNRNPTDYAFLSSEGIGWASGTSTDYGMICEYGGTAKDFKCSPKGKSLGSQSGVLKDLDNVTAPTETKTSISIMKETRVDVEDKVTTEYIPNTPTTSVSNMEEVKDVTEHIPTKPNIFVLNTDEVKAVTENILTVEKTSISDMEEVKDVTEHTQTKEQTSVSNMEEVNPDAENGVTTEHIPTNANILVYNVKEVKVVTTENVVTVQIPTDPKTNISTSIRSRMSHSHEESSPDGITDVLILPSEMYPNQSNHSGNENDANNTGGNMGSSWVLYTSLSISALLIIVVVVFGIILRKRSKSTSSANKTNMEPLPAPAARPGSEHLYY